jgi:predicted HTH transcriptional regulator
VQGGQVTTGSTNIPGNALRNDQKSGLKNTEWPEKWPEKAQQIIEAILRNKNVSIQQLEEQLQIGHTTIKKILREMQVEGIIRRVGPDKGGHWEIIEK